MSSRHKILAIVLAAVLSGCGSLSPPPPVKPNQGLAGVLWAIAINPKPGEVKPLPQPGPKPDDLPSYEDCMKCIDPRTGKGRGWLGDGRPRSDCLDCTHPKWDTHVFSSGDYSENPFCKCDPCLCDPCECGPDPSSTEASGETGDAASAASSTNETESPEETTNENTEVTESEVVSVSKLHNATENNSSALNEENEDAQPQEVPAPSGDSAKPILIVYVTKVCAPCELFKKEARTKHKKLLASWDIEYRIARKNIVSAAPTFELPDGTRVEGYPNEKLIALLESYAPTLEENQK